MGSPVIFEQRGGGTAGTTHWLVEHYQPSDGTAPGPGLIRFYKANGQRKLLDQIAQWLPEGGWDRKRWVPSAPPLPKWLIDRVEAHMRTEEGL
jgi:hypothetical protein